MSLTEFERGILNKLDDLCSRITRLEEKVKNHLSSVDKKQKSRKELVLTGIAIVSTLAAIYGVLT